MPKTTQNALSDITVRQAKPRDKEYTLSDGNGLALIVTTSGGKIWRLRCRAPGGGSFNQTLGRYPAVGLSEARKRRDAAMELRAAGLNPATVRKQEQREAAQDKQGTFEAVALEWHGRQGPVWTESHRERVLGRLVANAFPALATRPIADITAPELLAVLRVMEKRSVEGAHKLHQTCGQIFRYGIATGRCDRDIAADLRGALSPLVQGHFAAITDPKGLAPVLSAMWGYQGTPWVRAALRLTPMLAVRPGELRQMEWAELDLDKAEWSIPAHKMKMRQAHIVPLATQAVATLQGLHPLTGHGQYVFPNPRAPRGDRPMSENAVRVALRTLGFDNNVVTAHGFRATFRTIGAEVLGENPLVLEAQLAHRVPDALGTAYNRTSYLPQRKAFMQKWADYLDQLRGDSQNG